MSEIILVNLEKIKTILGDFRNEGLTKVSTTEVLQRYQGGYYKNTDTSPSKSINANFGRVLKHNEIELEITELSSEEPTVNNIGRETNPSLWQLNKKKSN
ncbi:MAG: hypothetical protein KAI03_01895 [Candidatus Aureabacteria bacterium]|nr:hypothetical protein [Candidatus Auribacterota bacterium]